MSDTPKATTTMSEAKCEVSEEQRARAEKLCAGTQISHEWLARILAQEAQLANELKEVDDAAYAQLRSRSLEAEARAEGLQQQLSGKWFLLYDGTSPDGRGLPDFVGRTTSQPEAFAFILERYDHGRYWTGYVAVVTDSEIKHAYKAADL